MLSRKKKWVFALLAVFFVVLYFANQYLLLVGTRVESQNQPITPQRPTTITTTKTSTTDVYQANNRMYDDSSLQGARVVIHDIPVLVFQDASDNCEEVLPILTNATLYQAALHNQRVMYLTECKETFAVLQKQKRINGIWNRVKVVHFAQYERTQEIEEYKREYNSKKPLETSNSEDMLWRFELLCIVRWMVTYQFIVDNNLEQVASIDRDALLYVNVTRYAQETNMQCGLLLEPPRSAGSFSILSRRCLREFIDIAIQDINARSAKQQRPQNDMAIFGHYFFHALFSKLKRQGLEFNSSICTVPHQLDACMKKAKVYKAMYAKKEHVDDLIILASMTKVRKFSKPIFQPESIPDEMIETAFDPKTNKTLFYSRYFGTFDQNYSGDEDWVRNGEYKRVAWINGYPYFQKSDMDFMIAALGLHFQGGKKGYARKHIQFHLRQYTSQPLACIVDVEALQFCESFRG